MVWIMQVKGRPCREEEETRSVRARRPRRSNSTSQRGKSEKEEPSSKPSEKVERDKPEGSWPFEMWWRVKLVMRRVTFEPRERRVEAKWRVGLRWLFGLCETRRKFPCSMP